jgi:sugar-phosphatase
LNDILFAGRAFDAFLFDVDGTLLSSIEVAERVWTRWAKKFDIDAATFLPQIHGRRAADSVRHLNIPGIDVDKEVDEITQAEMDDIDGVHAIEGAKAFLESLPDSRWAIVTSASRALAQRRLHAVGLRLPNVLVTAEDIVNGKPDPACYRTAAERLGFDVRNCLVFEDAEAGVRAGENAGAEVMVITAVHHDPLKTSHPTSRDYRNLHVVVTPTGQLQLVDSTRGK